MTSPANCNERKPRKVIDLPPGSKLAYTVDEAAQALGVGVTTMWTMLREGEVVAKKVRGRTVVPRDELLRVIEEAPAARAA
nr:helix-turn-helix domain-containing protein [uncultured Brevundimonas sp.]